MSFQINYQQPNSAEKSRELLEPGWYTLEVVNAYETDQEGKPLLTRTGTPFVKLFCQDEKSETVILHLLFLDEDNARRISALLFACRIEVSDGDRVEISATTFMGCRFRGKVEIEVGKDLERRNKIIRVIRLADQETTDSPDADPTEEPASGDPVYFEDGNQILEDDKGNSEVMTLEQDEKEDQVPF